MGRRNKIELAGTEIQREVVRKYYKEGKSLRSIEKELREKGMQVSKESIRRFVKKYRDIAKTLIVLDEKVDDKTLIEQAQSLQEIAYGIVQEAFSLYLNQVEDPAERLAFALSFLEKISSATRATAQVSKTKHEIRQYWEELLNEIMNVVNAMNVDEEVKEKALEIIKRAFKVVLK